MEESKKQQSSRFFKVGVFALIAACSVLLPGAISHNESDANCNEQKLANIKHAISAVSAEVSEVNRNGFTELAQKDPGLMLSLNSQKFDAIRHQNLWFSAK